ncbi:retinal Mueller cells isomerohydrolase-like [Babylonia areolata]|uniref:retinal Mueller cells isomerohydrolase-like n=1 Tax=Babylonia areolata TaxID=304850 RepID=UPI003FD1734D
MWTPVDRSTYSGRLVQLKFSMDKTKKSTAPKLKGQQGQARRILVAEAKGEEFKFNQAFLTLNAENATNTPVETDIVGQIPEWLEGSLYRSGPGIFKIGDNVMKHLFDGFCVLHRFHVTRGGKKVTYTSRVLDTDTYVKSVKANRLVASQFGTYQAPDPCKGILGRLMTFFKPKDPEELTDNVAVNIVPHGDRLYALTETPWLVHVHPETLLKEGRENLTDRIAVHMSTAHPHFDPEGNMYNLGTALNPPHNYNIVRIPPPLADSPDAQAVAGAELLASLTSRWKFSIGYNHSFGMSRDHFVILEQPITMGSFKFLTRDWRKAATYENFKKHPKEELVFRVIRRSDNREVSAKYRAEAAFTFHFVNCFEDQSQLVVDFTGYRDLDVIDELYLRNLDREGYARSTAHFRRYVLPLSVDQVEDGVNLVTLTYTKATAVKRRDGTIFLTPDYIIEGGVVMELPRINYKKVNAQKYRYVYGTRIFADNPKLVKLDLEEKKEYSWVPEDGWFTGEPVFVASPGATREDQGVVLSPVLATREGLRSFLVILDAASFRELARAVAPQGVRMPVTFHGSYVPPGDSHE